MGREPSLLFTRSALGVSSVWLEFVLCDQLVRPALSYGREVWTPLFTARSLRELDILHLTFLCRIQGVPRDTPHPGGEGRTTSQTVPRTARYSAGVSHARPQLVLWAE